MPTIGFHEDDSFPLKGWEMKLIADNFATIFYLSIYKQKDYEKWIQLPPNNALNEALNKLLKWSGIDEYLNKKENNETEESDSETESSN